MSVNSVGFQPQNPDDYAKTYADKNNLSLEEAKVVLKSKYGDPTRDGSNATSIFSSTGSESTQFIGDIATFGIDPDAYAQQYADANGLTLEEAKTELKEKYGEPQEMEFDKDIDPDYYVKLYAEENNITYEEAKAYFEEHYGTFE